MYKNKLILGNYNIIPRARPRDEKIVDFAAKLLYTTLENTLLAIRHISISINWYQFPECPVVVLTHPKDSLKMR